MLMWSATWPQEVQDLANDFFSTGDSDLQKDPYVHMNIGSTTLSANHNIHQIVEVVSRSEKIGKLISFLEEKEVATLKDKVIVFCATKRTVDFLTASLARAGIRASPIHGDKSQAQRDAAMNQFRTGRCPVLLATNVAARGIDVADIKYVINYDFPTCIEDYVHRIGRTGRQNKSGTSYTLFTEEESPSLARDLIDVLTEAGQEVNPELEQLSRLKKNAMHRKSGFSFR